MGLIGSSRALLGVLSGVMVGASGVSAGCGAGSDATSDLLPIRQEIGEVGLSPGQFSRPRCIDADEQSLWVIDKEARVQRIDARTGACRRIFEMPDSSLGKPTGITIGAAPQTATDGDTTGARAVWIADTHYHRVRAYAIDELGVHEGRAPELLMEFGSYGREGGQFIFPTDVAVLAGADGRVRRIYVSEYGGNDRVSVFDGAGAFLFAFGGFGEGPANDVGPEIRFSRPQSIAIVGDELLVADACNHRVGRFTLDGKLVKWIGGLELATEKQRGFNYPYGLAPLRDGTVLVSEFGNCRIRRLDPRTGDLLDVIGGPGRGKQGFSTPWGVAVIGGTAFVLDTGNNRIVGVESPRAGVDVAKRGVVSDEQLDGQLDGQGGSPRRTGTTSTPEHSVEQGS
ncbi:MAG: hypothetical protein SFZ23_15460 [Planctomycetota bacterium]|nr:hypothetical protein [Planctomycetota bacterium]